MFVAIGGLALCAATALGAFGAHGLARSAAQATWQAYMTAVDYQFYHGLGLCIVALLVNIRPDIRAFHAAGWAFTTGIVLFCGGIIATTLGAPGSLGRVVPLGGVAFMGGWLALAWGGLLARKRGATDTLA
jgi:uncharacterized membrane protein YgdD (TMEM256/DUF423 family)